MIESGRKFLERSLRDYQIWATLDGYFIQYSPNISTLNGILVRNGIISEDVKNIGEITPIPNQEDAIQKICEQLNGKEMVRLMNLLGEII